MAIRPDWTAGTLTLVAGSKDFTTTGSALETAALQAGDAIITVSGYVLIIEAITGQNSGTLYAECPVAAAGEDQPLRIRYQPDGSRVQGAMRMVRELLTSGNLEAFATLAGEEDAVPVFVGPGVIKLVPKSEFGPDDTKGNLAAVAQLDSIANLTELASLAKANEQFVVMDAHGKIAIVPFKQFTDEVAKKYQLPDGGSEQQLLNGIGGVTLAVDLPVSIAMQAALNAKASYNWIVNGDFSIKQRGNNFTLAPNEYKFTADRWGVFNGTNQICTVTVWEKDTVNSWVQTKYAPVIGIKFGVAPTTGEVQISQPIEGVETLAGEKATFTFYGTKANEIDAAKTILIQYFGSEAVESSVHTVNSFSKTTDYDSTGDVNLRRWDFVYDLPSVKGKKLTGKTDYLRPVICYTPRTTTERVFTRISLLEGDASKEADPFPLRHAQQELSLCQRYFCRVNVRCWAAFAGVMGYTTQLPVSMRVAPSVNLQVNSSTGIKNMRVETPTTLKIDILGETDGNTSGCYFDVLASCNSEL